MQRYYDPEIFHQTFDGIDLDNYVVASYYLRDRLEGQKFLDHLSLVQSMGLEGSTGTWEKVEEDTAAVREAMSSRMVGYHEINRAADKTDINVSVMLHASHMIAMMKQIAWPVMAKLCRLCGADLMLTPTMWSSIPMVSLEEGLRTSFMKLAPWHHTKRTFPMPCAGVYPGLAEVIIGEYGPDIIIPAGGGMLGHPDGYTAGAQSWQQAIAAVMADVPLPEAARKPENKALRGALEKWGYATRPSTPWLRVSPEFQPKAMKFD